MNEDISFRPGDHLLNRMTASGCSHNSFGMLRFDPQTHVYIYIYIYHLTSCGLKYGGVTCLIRDQMY